ncbi:response regulator transcription factor [Streptomyces bohaiensis]|uniref:Response regulator transcription factor n=1 Tax=Streptomyces bohaiensis TaxID=1431344 RepID=A0ABX1CA86_9ACTN|nr:LuxR C-terminal-related transcriptional regulator [Streptomyces bohaiensis]NJQ14049.1 response regulator transcription factor [Streptomyces bohaiensis]
MSIRIVLAYERCLFAEALARILDGVPDFDVAGIAGQRHEVLPVARRKDATVLVLGESLLDEAGKAESFALRMRRELPMCGIAAILPTGDGSDPAGLPRHDGIRFVPADGKLPHLVDAIREIEGSRLAGTRATCQVPRRTRCLGAREQEVLRSTMSGASVKEMSKELFLAPGTVRNLASSAIGKLGARNRFDAARIALEQGLL